jgi:hypothetical protein
MRYVPFHKLGTTPNLIVDGKSHEASVLTLSHWPGSGTPPKYKDDLSAQIVFRYLDDPDVRLLSTVDVVSNNHFDEDGLVSMYALINPELAMEDREVLIDIARAGDFGTFSDRESARVSFVLSAWSNPDLSPLNQGVFARPYPEVTAILYEELLMRLPKIIQKIDNLRRYWQEEDDFLTLTEEAFEKGIIKLQEYPEVDLAVVVIEDKYFPPVKREHCVSWISSVLHPMAVHNRTDCMRILVMRSNRYEFYFRYETWVDYVSRPLKPRLNLASFAKFLTGHEKGRTTWHFSGIDELIARLSMADGQGSRIDSGQFVIELREALALAEQNL